MQFSLLCAVTFFASLLSSSLQGEVLVLHPPSGYIFRADATQLDHHHTLPSDDSSSSWQDMAPQKTTPLRSVRDEMGRFSYREGATPLHSARDEMGGSSRKDEQQRKTTKLDSEFPDAEDDSSYGEGETTPLHSGADETTRPLSLWRMKRVLGVARTRQPESSLHVRSKPEKGVGGGQEYLQTYVRGHFGLSRYSFDRPRPLRWG